MHRSVRIGIVIVVCGLLGMLVPGAVVAYQPPNEDLVSELVEALDKDIDAVFAAAERLATSREPEAAVKQTVSALQKQWLAGLSEQGTLHLVALLENWSGTHASARELLVRLLEDDRLSIRQAALEAALRCEAVENPRILPLIASLRHAAPDDRSQAAAMLAKFGPQAAPAVGALVRTAQDESLHAALRWQAVFALRDIGPAGVAGLVEVLETTERSVAYKTLDSLIVLGPQADLAFPTAVQALQNEDPRIRLRALAFMARLPLRAGESIPIMQRSLSDPDQHVRDAAQQALGHLQEAASPTRPLPPKSLE